MQDDIDGSDVAPQEPEPTQVHQDDSEALPDELINAKKFRDVIDILYQQGYTTVDAIEARCKEIEDQVEMVRRVAQRRTRIERQMDIMGLL